VTASVWRAVTALSIGEWQVVAISGNTTFTMKLLETTGEKQFAGCMQNMKVESYSTLMALM
jgi:hypothetical protein